MAYKKLSELTIRGHTWHIKAKVMRMWDSINPSPDELISIDMIQMDEQVFSSHYNNGISSTIKIISKIIFIQF